MEIPKISDIMRAADRIRPFVHRTPVLTSQSINRITQAEIFFKCENLQKVGAFKFRGACNAVFSLSDEEAERGVATHSSGNHAQALALAARMRCIGATIVMPDNSPDVKKNAVAEYGARIVFCRPTLEAREEALARVVEETGAVFVHPYNDPRVICGQGTAALELFKESKTLDYLLAPVGGGGLMSGTLITASALSARTRVVGAEPEGADDAYRSLASGRIEPSINPKTIADGLLTSLGELTFEIIRKNIYSIVRVSDESIARAMRLVWERMKIVIEPSSATALAVVLDNPQIFRNQRIGIILSGGNVDLGKLPW